MNTFTSQRHDFLSASVGNALTNHPRDVRTTKRNLSRLGFFDEEVEQDYITSALDQGIKAFQSEQNLRIDGKMFPGGETERAMFERLSGRKAESIFGMEDLDSAGTVGFGGNISGTFAPVQKREKIDAPFILIPQNNEEKDESLFTTITGIRVNKDKIAQRYVMALKGGEEREQESSVPIPSRKPEKKEDTNSTNNETPEMKKEDETNNPKNNQYCINVYNSLRDIQMEISDLNQDRIRVETSISNNELKIHQINDQIQKLGVVDIIDPRNPKGKLGPIVMAAEIVLTGKKLLQKTELEEQIKNLRIKIAQLKNKAKRLDTHIQELHEKQTNLAQELRLNCPDFNE